MIAKILKFAYTSFETSFLSFLSNCMFNIIKQLMLQYMPNMDHTRYPNDAIPFVFILSKETVLYSLPMAIYAKQ